MSFEPTLGFSPSWREVTPLLALLGLIWLPMLLLALSFQRRRLDDLDCSKFQVFNSESVSEAFDQPQPPLSCRLRYLETHSWYDGFSMNTRWIWMTLGIALIWTGIILTAFLFQQSTLSGRILLVEEELPRG